MLEFEQLGGSTVSIVARNVAYVMRRQYGNDWVCHVYFVGCRDHSIPITDNDGSVVRRINEQLAVEK